jgi:uncharacterized iron-regulated membrane protein
MARQRMMQRIARWHIWLGWLIGVPILIWTISGLVMVARPIAEVRGTHLRAAAGPIEPGPIVFPALAGGLHGAELVRQPLGPVWIVTEADGRRLRYYARDGSPIPPVTRSEARDIARAAYAGPAALAALTYLPADAAPLELRLPQPTWQAQFGDGTNLYIDDASGEVLALRTRWWRIYDFMWGLHIMDLETREDTHHPVIILFAALAIAGSLLGMILLFRRRQARVKAGVKSGVKSGVRQ